MNDPLRKPRKLRFRVSRALLISAPLIGGLACGEPPITNTGPVPEPPEERVNVPALEEAPTMAPTGEAPTMDETIGQPVEPSTNVVEATRMTPEQVVEEPPPPPPRPRMVNPGPRPPRMHTVNPAPGTDDGF